MDLDDRSLILSDARAAEVDVPASASSSRLYIAIAVAALFVGGFGAWLWTRTSQPPKPVAAAVSGTEGALAPAAEPARPLPALGQMDTFLRALIGALSSHPQLARWLATDDLIRQMADGIDKVSRGQAPRVAVLRPQRDFQVLGAGTGMRIDPASYRRYDSLAAMVSSLHPTAVVDAYTTIRPRLDEAYHALGRSENTVDEALNVALNQLIETPEVRDPIRLRHGKGATYAFADPKLEALSPVQKLLIRMGPENSAAIRERLREIANQLAAASTPPRG